jgi:predicted MFS family arabinose efflux permease
LPKSAAPGVSPALVGLFALACGIIVGNLYYAQPIIDLIAPDIGLSDHTASLIVSLTQIGYVLGMLFVAPLGDILENKRLIIGMTMMALISLLLSAVATNGGVFLFLALMTGLTAVSVQILVPLAAHMADDATRGRVVGNIMGGLLLGILLSRPASSLIADHFGWRAVFFAGAGLMVLIAGLLFLTLPVRRPEHKASYASLIVSLGTLWRTHAPLRQRALIQGSMFCAFSLFWTASPLELAKAFHLSQSQIALFALVGAAGAAAAPVSGWLADKGHMRITSLTALICAAAAMLVTLVPALMGIVTLALMGVILDACVQLSMVQGQRIIYGLDPASRGRMNGIYMASIFIGGAVGSALASPLYTAGGWTYVAVVAAVAPLLGLAVFLSGLMSTPKQA